MRQVRITATVFESGDPVLLAGQLYPANDETLRQVAKGNGVEEVVELASDESQSEAAALSASTSAQQGAAVAAAPAPAPPPPLHAPARKRTST